MLLGVGGSGKCCLWPQLFSSPFRMKGWPWGTYTAEPNQCNLCCPFIYMLTVFPKQGFPSSLASSPWSTASFASEIFLYLHKDLGHVQELLLLQFLPGIELSSALF